jgi:hypothetical protein
MSEVDNESGRRSAGVGKNDDRIEQDAWSGGAEKGFVRE